MNLPSSNVSSKTWTRRNALWLMTGAMAGLGLHGCRNTTESTPNASTTGTANSSSPSSSGETMKAVMGAVTWIGNTPLYIALEKGFFKEFGLDLQMKIFDTIPQSFPSFLTGQIDGLAPVMSEALLIASKGMDFKIVTVEDTSVGADVLLARNKVRSLNDLKGQKIGVEIGSVGQFFVLRILSEAGLSEKDVTLVNMSPAAAAAAYQAGNLDVAYTFSPFSDKANAAQKDGRILYSSKQMPTAIADLYIFSTKYINANPKAVEAFVKGNFKGLEFLKTNPKEGLAIMAKQLKITPEELDQQLKGIQMPSLATNVEMLGNPNSAVSLVKPMQELAQFMKDKGKIPAVPDVTKLIDPQFVKAAV